MRQLLIKIYNKTHKLFNLLPFNNRYCLRGTKLKNYGKGLIRCRFDCKGKGNIIILKPGGRIRNTSFTINGNNNIIEIGENTYIAHGDFYIEDNGGRIEVGNNTKLCGQLHLACTEGKTIHIGDDCLFSSDIVFRSGDSHSVLDMNGNRINHAKDIVIGNHVWVGYRVLVNKGVSIAANSIIGTGSVVTKAFEESNVVIAGVPAKVVKKGVTWSEERV